MNTETPGIFPYMDVSTIHIRKQDADWLDLQHIRAIGGEYVPWITAKYPEGYWVLVPENLFELVETSPSVVETVPMSILTLWHRARRLNCGIIRIDRDGTHYPDLRRYEW